MANALLTEIHCARLLVAVLASRYGFELDNHKGYAHMDYYKQKMFIKADVSNGEAMRVRRFYAELTFDDLQRAARDVEDILTTQVQPQVFSTWNDQSINTGDLDGKDKVRIEG
jgi:hypothetical protein